MTNTSFETIYCKGNISLINNNMDVEINGEITDKVTEQNVYYVAPAPCDMMTTFSGSGLPFANKEQAFSNTPNQGVVKLNENKFTIHLMRPNSYYKDFNNIQLPHVYITYNTNKTVNIELADEKIAYRSLQYPPLRTSQEVSFYDRKLPIRSQEKILRDSGYNDLYEAPDFWGLKPPV